MERPCVRVSREAGEETRQALAAANLVDGEHEIVVDDGTLYLPVTDPEAAAERGFEVVDHDVPAHDRQQTPADLLGFEPSYERLGDVAIVDEDDPERASDIAAAIIDSDLPVRAVLDRASKVKGELRVRDWTVLATEDDEGERPVTETVHREYGFEYLLDLSRVYFSPRLATERHRVTEQVTAGEQAVDMFAGVGPFVIPMADRGATVVGVDLNPAAIEYLRENARRNGVEDRVTAIQGDVRDVAADYADWADRVVMNLPHSAEDFLDSAVTLAGDDCVIHYYDIQHEDDPFGPGERAIREAATDYDVDILTRHVVRSYAPHELNVCLDVRLSR
ncbi:MAG: class I SAM-dependent methyltransferase family protein [Haloplanus sp.]